MYRGLVHVYMVGLPDGLASVIKSSAPLPSFEHSFSESAQPDPALAAAADVVFLRTCVEDALASVEAVQAAARPGTELVLIAPHGALDALGDARDALSDFWAEPLDACEAAFRFGRWQQRRKQEADLWESRQFLDATIDSIPSLVWYKTRDGVHEKVNSSFCETVKKTKEQVQGQRHAYIWDVEEDDPACIESENEVMASGKTCVSEEVVQTGDGTRLLTTYKSPLYDLDGSVMGTVGVGIDVTQERAYENDLVEKNHTLETIFTTLDCGVMTHSLDGARILGVNRTALDILGFESEEEMKAKGFDMIASTVIDEDAGRLREENQVAHRSGRQRIHGIPRAPRGRRASARHGQHQGHREGRREVLPALPARRDRPEGARRAEGPPRPRPHPGAQRGLHGRVRVRHGHGQGRPAQAGFRRGQRAGEDIPRRYLTRPHHQGRTSTRACTRTTSRCCGTSCPPMG